MAYSEITNGNDLFIFTSSSTPLAHATSWTLNLKNGTRNVTDKESGSYEQLRPNRFTVTASAEGMIAYGDFEAMVTGMTGKSVFTLYFGKGNRSATDATVTAFASASTYASGAFYMTSFQETAPMDGNATYSVEFEHCSGFAFCNK